MSEASTTVSERVRTSPAVHDAIDILVNQVVEQSRGITDVRPPNPALDEAYRAIVDKAGRDRGRGLFLPYVASGLGNGALVELADGSVKWDMITGIGVSFFGHSHPDLIRASLEASLEDTAKHGNLQSGRSAFRFAELLLENARRGSKLAHAFVTTSGCMANESAIKVCYQKHAPATRVIAFEHCFMGRSVTMSNIGDSAAARVGIPLSTQVDYMPFMTEAAVEKAGGETKFIDYACDRLREYIGRYPKQHACFIFELVQGEGGFNVGSREFFEELMKICKASSIAVWDDEIQTFGRTTEMFAYDAFGLGQYVDVLCVGKMTQACAALFTEEYNPKPGLLSGTFTGSSQDFAVGNRMLELLASGDFYGPNGSIAQHHAAFRRHAEALVTRRPEWFPKVSGVSRPADGIGGMMRLTPFGGNREKVVAAVHRAFEEGIVLFFCGHGPYHLRMLAPLGVMKLEDWPRVFERLEVALSRVD